MALRFYPAVIVPNGEGFGVVFPDFPGCVTVGTTEQEVAVNAAEALALHVEGVTEDGEALPAPSRLLDALPEWLTEDVEGLERAPCVLVPVESPERVVRVNITMDEGLLRRLDSAAERGGFTRSGFLAQAVREKLAGGE